MRILFINIIVVLVATVAIQVQGQKHRRRHNRRSEENENNNNNNNNNNDEDDGEDATPTPFLQSKRGETMMMNLMNDHFIQSFNYLYTSKQFGGQTMQRPGLAKYLSEASDREWEQGLDVLKKYMQRGGNIGAFRNGIKINSMGEVNMNNPGDKSECYATAFTTLQGDAKKRFDIMNKINQKASNHAHRDAEIAHYLDEQQTKEADQIYELTIYKNIVEKMKPLGLALNFFDSSL